MSVRCKMQLLKISEHAWSSTARTLEFQTQYDQTIPEDQRFTKATPNGQITMLVDNPAALEKFKIGKHYYVDFTAIDEK